MAEGIPCVCVGCLMAEKDDCDEGKFGLSFKNCTNGKVIECDLRIPLPEEKGA
ncbi:MAG: hypothetical protein PHC85_00340 [Candidatus Pacebacteria bacterium]|nr:hypothetical protein [Candidatus Paceibacterota bacterium]